MPKRVFPIVYGHRKFCVPLGFSFSTPPGPRPVRQVGRKGMRAPLSAQVLNPRWPVDARPAAGKRTVSTAIIAVNLIHGSHQPILLLGIRPGPEVVLELVSFVYQGHQTESPTRFAMIKGVLAAENRVTEAVLGVSPPRPEWVATSHGPCASSRFPDTH